MDEKVVTVFFFYKKNKIKYIIYETMKIIKNIVIQNYSTSWSELIKISQIIRFVQIIYLVNHT